MLRARFQAILGIASALLLSACGAEDPPIPHVFPEGGVRRDGRMIWPDYGRLPDYSQPRDGGGPADRSGDGGGGGSDAQPSCPGPLAAKCSSACAADELCTEAKGGTCVKALVLTGSSSDKAVLRDVAMAYVRCWAKAPTTDLLCYTFNTCAMSGVLTEQAVKDWVCGKAGVSDFPAPPDFEAARGLCQCDFWKGELVYRPDWKLGSIVPGKRGIVCLTYDVNPWWQFDKLNVNDCQHFPPM